MFISYFDESGDDGYPVYSSELFVLTSIYMHHSFWKENYTKVSDFRKFLKKQYGMPVNQEFHTSNFITDKNPYHGLYTPSARKEILMQSCAMAASLNMTIVSVVIDKRRINRPNYDVLRNALTYNIQRIENDLSRQNPETRFMIITDEGRVSKMRTTTRSIQRINYIPSMYGTGSYRQEIKTLIEDPLPKDSSQSYFIQIADMISLVVSLYAKQNLCEFKIPWANRIQQVLSHGDEVSLMNILRPRINAKASRSNEYGVVYYPK